MKQHKILTTTIMKQFLFTLTFLFSVSFVNSQVFNGVPISGNLQTCITKFKQKGFTFVKYNPHGASMSGMVSNKQVELYIVVTPKSKTVCKVAVYFPKRNTWSNLYSEYSDMRDLLTTKYGDPDLNIEKFNYPYELGDGFETTAIAMEKCDYTTIWLDRGNTNIVVEISQFLQTYIAYENKKNMDLRELEEQSINMTTF